MTEVARPTNVTCQEANRDVPHTPHNTGPPMPPNIYDWELKRGQEPATYSDPTQQETKAAAKAAEKQKERQRVRKRLYSAAYAPAPGTKL